MATLTQALKRVAPQVDATAWAPVLTAAFAKYAFNTNKRMAAALGQFLVETPAFHTLEESLYYTTAARLRAVFSNFFRTDAEAAPYLRAPEKLANHVYAGVNGNGDEASGDGWTFRGRGLIQLTGRNMYTTFGATVGKTPAEAADDCLTDAGAAMSGCWYLADNGCLTLADAWNIAAITKRVNRKMLGAAQRLHDANAMLAALSD